MLKNAACEISAGLSGKYLGSDGQMRPVGGDLNKVAYVPGLSQEALRLLQEARHIMGKLPGTSGVRTLMRYRAKAMQVAYGAPVFVTLSPAEKHNYLMLRLARWRRTDPAVVQDPSLQKVAGRLQPGPEDRSAWPDFEERRQVLALKPAAAVLGFRVHVLLLLRAVFGIRTCLFCPACQSQKDAESFCSDLEGNASELVGGAFGRSLKVCSKWPRWRNLARGLWRRARQWWRRFFVSSSMFACKSMRCPADGMKVRGPA